MKAWWMMAVAAVLTVLAAVPALASSNLVVGYMGTQEVLASYTAYQAAYRELEAVRGPLEQQLKEKQEEIRQLQRELETNLLLSESRKQQLQEQIRTKMVALQQQMEENQQALNTQEKAKVEPLMKALQEAIKKVAAARGYNVVQERGNPGLLWIDPALDITADVIAEVNR